MHYNERLVGYHEARRGNLASLSHRECGGSAVPYPDKNGPLVCEKCGANINLDSQLNVS